MPEDYTVFLMSTDMDNKTYFTGTKSNVQTVQLTSKKKYVCLYPQR